VKATVLRQSAAIVKTQRQAEQESIAFGTDAILLLAV